jgi:hypothetical protein
MQAVHMRASAPCNASGAATAKLGEFPGLKCHRDLSCVAEIAMDAVTSKR